MPFYDLTCSACGIEYNKKASIAQREAGEITCPTCGATDPHTRYEKRNSLTHAVRDAAPACPNAHRCGTGCCHAQ